MRARLLLPLTLALAAGCGVNKDKYLAKELEAQALQKQLQDESAKSADLNKKLTSLEEKIAAKQGELEALGAAKAKLEQEKGQLEQEKGQLKQEKVQLEEKSSQYEQLASSLKGQIQTGQIEISELRGKMTVKLKDKILFASGSAAIGKEGKSALDSVAGAFINLKGKTILVAGYTDDVPTSKKGGYQTNWELSAARAIAVVRYLQDQGVDPQILGAAGYSEYRPLAANDTPEGRSANRRIEIVLGPSEAQDPQAAPATEKGK